VLFFLIALALMKMRGAGARGSQLSPMASSTALLKPGSKVAELEAAMERAALPPSSSSSSGQQALASVDPAVQVRDRARELASTDPQRAAHIVRAWINVDNEEAKQRA
jgi:flagellar biosynthesis/type III secretory pathway M-ring protein FliF/YscJ